MQKPLPPFLLLAILAIGSPAVHAQYAFQDAVNLKLDKPLSVDGLGRVHLPGTPQALQVVHPYVPAGDSLDNSKIISDFSTNPFIQFDTPVYKSYIPAFNFNPPSSISGLDVTNVANGLAALLVERAKQELTIAFFNRLQTFAAKPEFTLLFPTTANNLKNLVTFSYPQVLPILRNGFFSDLRSLPAHLPGLLDIAPYDKLFANYPELRITIRSLALIAQIQSGASTPADMLDDFAAFPDWQAPGNSQLMNNLGASVKLAALISHSLRSSKKGQVWVDPSDLKPLLTDTILSRIYLGLLWQIQHISPAPIVFSPGLPLTDLLDSLKNDVSKAQRLITRINEFIALAGQINTAFKTIEANNKTGTANTNTDYYNYIGVTIDAVDTAFGIVDLFYPNLDAKPYLALARTGNGIYKDIYSQQYTQAISDGLDFLGQLGPLAKNYTPPPATAHLTNPTPAEKANALETLSDFVNKAKPYVLFMANLAEASSASDVQAALENAILPVGSSSVKKNTHDNLSVQAYLGAYAVTSHTGSSATGMWADDFGVTAPIGISYTPGFASRGRWGALSLFLEVFDLGAIVDYDLRTDTVTNGSGTPTTAISKNYSVKLGQILSPGAYVVYGAAGNLPLALGFGGQYGPGLSSINTSGQTTVANPSWRWNFFLTVDLPLFNIWNVTKSSQ